MLQSLRARLLLSYLSLVGLVLCIISITLVLLLRDNPIGLAQSYRRLSDIARASIPYLANNDPASNELDSRLSQIAAASETRIIRTDAGGQVVFDSRGEFTEGISLQIRPLAADPEQVARGTFTDQTGQVWLFFRPVGPQVPRSLRQIIFAIERPRSGIANLLGENALVPLAQAAIIGGLVSIIFAILTSNWISSPLSRTADVVRAVTGGDFTQQAPEQGPREVKELSSSFNQMTLQVKQARQIQQDFLANISHELKTPLTSIRGFSQAIIDEAVASPSEAARIIFAETERMGRLVADLLELARLEAGRARMTSQSVDVWGLVRAVCERLGHQAGQQGVLLEYGPVEDTLLVSGDADRLSQVFVNLVENALNHTPAGGRISLHAAPHSSDVHITVSDSGSGIPPEDIHRIFERFYQADKSRARSGRKGTGLGLTISKEIVEAHGGRVTVESPPDQGARFHVWLPRLIPADTMKKT